MSKSENTPFLNRDDASAIPSYTRDYSRVPQEETLLDVHEIDENDIVSYVQQRRQSIASVGTEEVPTQFTFNRQMSRGFDDTLTSVRSNASANVLDILSHTNLVDEPETTYKTEVKALFKYSVPLVITFLLQYSLTIASVFSVGKLGSEELGAVSLSSMTANVSGYAIIQGVSTCLDTLCAQSYGKKEYKKVGLQFMRCNYLLLLLFIPMFILWFFFSESILLKIIGEDETKLCHFASLYLQVLSLGLPGFILFENAKHFLQSQGIFHASTYVLAICAPINIILNYLLVWNPVIGMGFIGAPVSVVITNWLMFTLLYLYIFFIGGYKCWPNHSVINWIYFKNWNKMINLSVPGVLMVEAEWLAFEIITFAASQFGTDTLAAQSIVSTTCVLLYQIPFAISIAASTRVAWFIGAASKKAATIATRATLLVAVLVGSFTCALLLSLRGYIPQLYTKNPAVIELASKVLIVGGVYQVNDAVSCLANGILRGQGRQKIGGYLSLISYYLIALPLAIYLAFIYDLKLLGLWMGMSVALVTLSLLQLYFIFTCDWDEIINECINDSLIEGDGSIIIDNHSFVPSMSSNTVV